MRQPKIRTTLRTYTGSQFKADLIDGLTVAMVALPLSLAIAIAIASGADPATGLVTAIVAGFLISALGGNRGQLGGPTGAFIVVLFTRTICSRSGRAISYRPASPNSRTWNRWDTLISSRHRRRDRLRPVTIPTLGFHESPAQARKSFSTPALPKASKTMRTMPSLSSPAFLYMTSGLA